jgi:hypothetical protein
MPSIYLAASHRNEVMSDVLVALRKANFTVYSPHESGFTWPAGALLPRPEDKFELYRTRPAVTETFGTNLQMLYASHAVVGCEPLGVDAAIMFGMACHAKPDATYLLLSRGDRVLASLASAHLCTTIESLIEKLVANLGD